MRKSIWVAALVVAFVSGQAWAGPGCGSKHKAAGQKSGCHSKKMVSGSDQLPKMVYRVGDFDTPCSKTAEKMAGEKGTVTYVVGGEEFSCQGAASNKLADLLELEAENMMLVRMAVGDQCVGCPVEAQRLASEKGMKVSYRVAGQNFETREKADTAAEKVRHALAKYAADNGKAGCCGTCSKSKAATASGKAGCDKPCGSKAATASGKTNCCGTCSKSKAATASGKAGCDKPCGSKAATASGKTNCCGTCSKSKAATASGKAGCDKPCGSKAATVSAKAGCDKPCGSKATTASGKAGCPSSCSKTKTAAGDEVPCRVAAEQRLADVRARINVISETGEQVRKS